MWLIKEIVFKYQLTISLIIFLGFLINKNDPVSQNLFQRQ